MPFDRDLRTLLRSLEDASLPAAASIDRRLARSDRQFENDVEMAARHVREGEAHVARQRELVLQRRAQGLDSFTAEELLAQFEDIRDTHRLYLKRLLKR